MAIRTVDREQEGHIIAGASGAIKRINRGHRVLSQSGNGSYDIVCTPLGWVCSCPDQKFRGVKCKHIFAVEISFAIRKQVEVARIEPISNINNCIYCSSIIIVKDGLRHNKHGDIQKFNCKECGKYFTINVGFEKMKHNSQGKATMQLYFSGESLRNTCESLQFIGMSKLSAFVRNLR